MKKKGENAIKRRIFISYNHKDRKWLKKVQSILDPLEKTSNITYWDDTHLKPGDNWITKTSEEISRSQVAILLVSANYLASDFIINKEVISLVEGAQTKETKILPLILNPCDFSLFPSISQFVFVNDPRTEALDNLSSEEVDKILLRLSQVIKNTFEPESGKGKTSTYDVFICHNSADYKYAAQIYEFLEEANYKVFLSEKSLPELGLSDYRLAIDEAIDNSTHMIVVASNIGNLKSKWVNAEWGMFVNEKRAGRKDGNIFTLASENIRIGDIPLTLRNYHVASLDPKEFEEIKQYLPL